MPVPSDLATGRPIALSGYRYVGLGRLGLLFCLGFALVSAAFGQLSFLVDARAVKAQLIVNEVEILTFRTGTKSHPPATRAQAAAAVLVKAKEGEVVELEPEGKSIRLKLGQRSVLTVTEADAKAQQSSVEGVAKAWASRLNDAILVQGIEVDQKSIELPPDRPATFVVIGSHARKAVVSPTNKPLLKLHRGVGKLSIRPLMTGAGELMIANGPLTKKIVVKVLPYAAKFPMHLTAQVTGVPASADVVDSAIQTAIQSRAPVEPGASVRVGPISANALAVGRSQVVDLPIKVEAPNRFPASGLVRVTVKNTPIHQSAERELWYSNDPENIVGPGQIYWGQLHTSEPIRFLFHHFNRASRPMVIQFLVVNESDAPATVAMIMGDSEPSDNPTLAGYRAGDQFMQAWLQRSGEMLVIPPHSVVPIVLRRIGPLDTASGLAHMTLLSPDKGKVSVVGDAIQPEVLTPAWRNAGYPAWPWRKLAPRPIQDYAGVISGTPRHVYPTPLRQEKFVFQVGGNFQFIRVGQEAIPDVLQSKNLLGNFGVHYDIRGTIANPTDRPTDVEIVFEASAGYSGALFVVNGKYIQANLLQAKQNFVLLTAKLNPGDVQPVAIQTVPLSGAHYPATVIVRPSGIALTAQTFREIVETRLN